MVLTCLTPFDRRFCESYGLYALDNFDSVDDFARLDSLNGPDSSSGSNGPDVSSVSERSDGSVGRTETETGGRSRRPPESRATPRFEGNVNGSEGSGDTDCSDSSDSLDSLYVSVCSEGSAESATTVVVSATAEHTTFPVKSCRSDHQPPTHGRYPSGVGRANGFGEVESFGRANWF